MFPSQTSCCNVGMYLSHGLNGNHTKEIHSMSLSLTDNNLVLELEITLRSLRPIDAGNVTFGSLMILDIFQ
jgi:hypothetical protein